MIISKKGIVISFIAEYIADASTALKNANTALKRIIMNPFIDINEVGFFT